MGLARDRSYMEKRGEKNRGDDKKGRG